jgi:hypothetical protein
LFSHVVVEYQRRAIEFRHVEEQAPIFPPALVRRLVHFRRKGAALSVTVSIPLDLATGPGRLPGAVCRAEQDDDLGHPP